jgi:hypothetical protein
MYLTNLIGFMAAGEVGFSVARSLSFVSASTTRLTRTFGAASDTHVFSFSTWLKRADTATTGAAILSNLSASSYWELGLAGSNFGAGTAHRLRYLVGGVVTVESTETIADTNWHHILVAVDTTQATASNRMHMYLDGTEVTYGATTYPALNAVIGFASATAHTIGARQGAAVHYNGLLADTYFVDGVALTPSAFRSGTSPKRYSGTLGNNGFWLSYYDPTSTTTLGYDDGMGVAGSASGSNDWTLTNMTTGNSSTDVPT